MGENDARQAGMVFAIGNDEIPQRDVVLVLDAPLAQGEKHQIGQMELGRGGNLNIPRDVIVFVGEVTALGSGVDRFQRDLGIELKLCDNTVKCQV